MVYDWNAAKARADVQKHGVSFEEASSIFLDPFAMTFCDPEHSAEEAREITIGYSIRRPRGVRCALPARRAHSNHQRAEGDQKRAHTV